MNKIYGVLSLLSFIVTCVSANNYWLWYDGISGNMALAGVWSVLAIVSFIVSVACCAKALDK